MTSLVLNNWAQGALQPPYNNFPWENIEETGMRRWQLQEGSI